MSGMAKSVETDVVAPTNPNSVATPERVQWAKDMRVKFSMEKMRFPDGTLDQQYFRPPKSVYKRWKNRKRQWTYGHQRKLIHAIGTCGLGSIGGLRTDGLEDWTEEELRGRLEKLFGRKNLQDYESAAWKGDEGAIAAQYARHRIIGEKNGVWSEGMLVDETSAAVKKALKDTAKVVDLRATIGSTFCREAPVARPDASTSESAPDAAAKANGKGKAPKKEKRAAEDEEIEGSDSEKPQPKSPKRSKAAAAAEEEEEEGQADDGSLERERCPICGLTESTAETGDNWIECDKCMQWSHHKCQGLGDDFDAVQGWVCPECVIRAKRAK